jgi:hypothetical protein
MVRIKGKDLGQGFRVGLQGQDLGLGFQVRVRVRIQGKDSG